MRNPSAPLPGAEGGTGRDGRGAQGAGGDLPLPTPPGNRSSLRQGCGTRGAGFPAIRSRAGGARNVLLRDSPPSALDAATGALSPSSQPPSPLLCAACRRSALGLSCAIPSPFTVGCCFGPNLSHIPMDGTICTILSFKLTLLSSFSSSAPHLCVPSSFHSSIPPQPVRGEFPAHLPSSGGGRGVISSTASVLKCL